MPVTQLSDDGVRTAPGRCTAVVANPHRVADLADQRSALTSALAARGWPDPIWLETTADDPGYGQTAQAIERGADIVVACGGDGTVMACVSVLAGSRAALAVLPAGTGNLLAANLDLPSTVEAVAVAIAGGHRRRLDVGRVGDRCFVVMAGMGFDAQMLDGAPAAVKARWGWPAYVVSGLRNVRGPRMRVRISIDGGEPMNRRARSVLVGNVGRLQGGVPVLPDAVPDDGLLDVAVLKPRTLLHWAAMAWGILRRRPDVAQLEQFRARRVDVVSDVPQLRELDGDVIEASQTLSAAVWPAALHVCVPAPHRH